jgi:hypothetical protein
VIWKRSPPHNRGGALFWVATKARAREVEELRFPKFDYHLDESDPDVVILRRQDDSFVAAFSARGATRVGIVEAAKEDYLELIRGRTSSLCRQSGEHLSS